MNTSGKAIAIIKPIAPNSTANEVDVSSSDISPPVAAPDEDFDVEMASMSINGIDSETETAAPSMTAAINNTDETVKIAEEEITNVKPNQIENNNNNIVSSLDSTSDLDGVTNAAATAIAEGILAEEPEIIPKSSDELTTVKPQQLVSSNTFNAEDFLARVNMNEKINNILRSPMKPGSAVRQRSVFTAITPSSVMMSRFNASAAPFVSQRNSANGIIGHHVLNAGMLTGKDGSSSASGIPSTVMGNASMISGNIATSRPLSIPVHHYGSYESSLTGRSPGLARGIFTRYPVPPPPAPIYGFDSEMCRIPPTMSPTHHSQQFPQPMPPPPFAVGRISTGRNDYHEHPTPPTCPGAGPIAMTNGTIQLRLRDGIRIDMTLDKAVRVLNQRSMVAVALSRNCSNSALIHPNGRVLQSGSKVEIVTYDGMKTNNYVRYAKMWYKGVSFTSESCALIYLVDTAGTRTTTDTFTDLTKDYTLTVFYDDSRHGPSYVQDANEVIQNSMYSCTDEGTEIYEINGFRITQAADGLVKLTRTHNKCLIRTSPGNGSATLTTPGIHCTASLGKTSHLFVRRNEKRMHFDGSCFIVRNAGHSAGFNENNLLIVY